MTPLSVNSAYHALEGGLFVAGHDCGQCLLKARIKPADTIIFL
jgi:hypothetical protein